MIGRLIEQQQIRTTHQRLRQIQAHAPAAGERVHRPFMRIGGKAQTMQQPRRARLRRVAVDRIQTLMQQCGMRAVLVLLGPGQLLLQCKQLAIAPHHVIDGRHRAGRRMLRHMGDHRARSTGKMPGILLELAANQCKQRRLAASVGAGQADTLAVMNPEAGIVEQQARTTPERDRFKMQHYAPV